MSVFMQTVISNAAGKIIRDYNEETDVMEITVRSPGSENWRKTTFCIDYDDAICMIELLEAYARSKKPVQEEEE